MVFLWLVGLAGTGKCIGKLERCDFYQGKEESVAGDYNNGDSGNESKTFFQRSGKRHVILDALCLNADSLFLCCARGM